MRPVCGIGRFEGTRYAAAGRLRANHAGVIDIRWGWWADSRSFPPSMPMTRKSHISRPTRSGWWWGPAVKVKTGRERLRCLVGICIPATGLMTLPEVMPTGCSERCHVVRYWQRLVKETGTCCHGLLLTRRLRRPVNHLRTDAPGGSGPAWMSENRFRRQHNERL